MVKIDLSEEYFTHSKEQITHKDLSLANTVPKSYINP